MLCRVVKKGVDDGIEPLNDLKSSKRMNLNVFRA